MSSVTYTTPAFLKALGNLAKENQVSNKEFKAKLAHKANRVKQLQRQRPLTSYDLRCIKRVNQEQALLSGQCLGELQRFVEAAPVQQDLGA